MAGCSTRRSLRWAARHGAGDIDSPTAVPGSGVRLDLLLTGLLLLGAVLFVYLLYTVLRRF